MSAFFDKIIGDEGLKTSVNVHVHLENEMLVKLGASLLVAGVGIVLSFFALRAISSKGG